MLPDSSFVARIISDVMWYGGKFVFVDPVADSRCVVSGGTFVALPGRYYDGHTFLRDALERGAASAVVSVQHREHVEELAREFPHVGFMVVSDVYRALIACAQTWRQQFDLPVLGVTGSMGKTTTRSLFHAMAERAGASCLSSIKNYNTVLGSALTLLRLREHHTCACIEMGIARRGDMEQLVDLVEPTLGIITTIAPSHTVGLGGVADIAREKRKIFSHFSDNNIGIVNADVPELAEYAYQHPVIKCGRKTTNHVQARRVSCDGKTTRFTLSMYGERSQLTLDTVNEGFVSNALVAAAAGHTLGFSRQAICEGIEAYRPVSGRFQVISGLAKNRCIVDDAYNANPASMRAALRAFDVLRVAGEKVAVIGDMLDLGIHAPYWHRQIGRQLRKLHTIRHVILVGKYVGSIADQVPEHMDVVHVASWQEALREVEKYTHGEAFLFKASHGMGFANIVSALREAAS